MESTSNVAKKRAPRNGWKITGIIFIVLTVILAISSGFLAWKYFEQDNKINNLNSEISELQVKLDAQVVAGSEPAEDQVDRYALPTPEALLAAFAVANPDVDTSSLTVTFDGTAQIIDATMPEVTGFQILEARVGSSPAIFYRQDPAADWIFIISSQVAGSCTDAVFTKDIVGKPGVPIYTLLIDHACYTSSGVETTFYDYYFSS